MTTQNPNPPVDEMQATRRLLDIITLPQLALIVLVFFLPLSRLECGTIKADFSGPSLAFGLKPDIKGAPGGDRDTGGGDEKNEQKASLLMGLVPLLALGAGALVVLRLKGTSPAAPVPPHTAKFAAGAIAAILIFYLLFGFAVERQIAADLEKEAPQAAAGSPEAEFGKELRDAVEYGKTGWFYVMLLFALGATGTLWARDWLTPERLASMKGKMAGPPPNPPPAAGSPPPPPPPPGPTV